MSQRSILRSAWQFSLGRKAIAKFAPEAWLIKFTQRAHFEWFRRNQNARTGLVKDRDKPNSPASIAATGFALAVYPIAADNGWITHEEAMQYTAKTLRALSVAPQGSEREGVSGNWGMFYHFLDPDTATRAVSPKFWDSELSTIDTALLMAGVLFAGSYFTADNTEERGIRHMAESLYARVEWDRFVNDKQLILHAWTPELGMWEPVYRGYSEALLLYILALGSPTHAAPAAVWDAFIGDAKTETHYGQTFIRMPGMPLFCYQYPQAFIDFRGITDGVNRRLGFDYHECARRAALAQHGYAVDNPLRMRDYSALDWGLTASDGPGGGEKVVEGRVIDFRWYSEHGGPEGFDDGTIAPTAALASMPYVPERSIATLRHWLSERPELFSLDLGFVDAFNPTFDKAKKHGWIDSDRIGIDQGPIVLMMENHMGGGVWSVMRRNAHIRRGLKAAGFTGGWLSHD
ncbi:MAG: Tat pathway signal protein [Leptolyngbya sp.]|nr:Tat pathway signal protein [Candidatus Melainabacteria bacterium]